MTVSKNEGTRVAETLTAVEIGRASKLHLEAHRLVLNQHLLMTYNISKYMAVEGLVCSGMEACRRKAYRARWSDIFLHGGVICGSFEPLSTTRNSCAAQRLTSGAKSNCMHDLQTADASGKRLKRSHTIHDGMHAC
jgi:hypothetical protein